MAMIRRVVLWSTGMVTVSDERRKQIAEYQGQLVDVREAILRDAPAEAIFEYGSAWTAGRVTSMPREAFARELVHEF